MLTPAVVAGPGSASASLRRLATRGTLWSLGGFGSGQLIRFGTNLVLTRLLFPELFGLMAVVYMFTSAISLCSDLGLGTNIVHNQRANEPDFLASMWTLQVVRGLGLGVASVVLAPLVAGFYGDDRLLWIVPGIGVTCVIAGFNSTRLLTSVRDLELGGPTRLESVAQVLSAGVAIAWAWVNPTVWALVAASVASALIRLVLSHRLPSQPRHRLLLDRASLRAAFPFGKWIWLATLFTFLATQVDRMMVGKLFTLELLGIYGIALTLSELPRNVITVLSTNVLYPTLTRVARERRDELRDSLLSVRWRVLVALALALVLLAGFGDVFVARLYDQRYAAAAWMLPVLALGVWPSVLAHTMDPALLALGVPRFATYGHLGRILFTLVGIPLGYVVAGLGGAVVIVALNDLPFYVSIARGLSQHRLSSAAQDLKASLLFAVLLFLVLVTRASVGLGFPIAGFGTVP